MADVQRKMWGGELGIPEGSDFTLEADLLQHGATDTGALAGATVTLSLSDTWSGGTTTILTDEATDSFNGSRAVWNITDSQSDGWSEKEFRGDIKAVLSGGEIRYWPVALKVRSVVD